MHAWTSLLVATLGLAACATTPTKPQGIFDLSNGLTSGDHAGSPGDTGLKSDQGGAPPSDNFRGGAGAGSSNAGNAFASPGSGL